MNRSDTAESLEVEVTRLRARLWEAEDALHAIRGGEVDALVFPTPEGEQIYVLRNADEPYRVLVEQLQEGALIVSTRGDILYSNQCLADLIGESLERVIGAPLLRYIAPQDQQAVANLLAEVRQRSSRGELSLLSADGTLRAVNLSVAPYINDGAEALCVVVTDLSQQKRSDALVADERLARSILDHVTEAVVVCEPDGRVIRANEEARRISGRPIIGATFAEAFALKFSGLSKDSAGFLRFALAGDRFRMVEATLLNPVGQPRELLVSGGPLYNGSSVAGAVIALLDITERKAVEHRLRQSQRLESIGRLAGGVAHEVNNQMLVVLGFAEFLSHEPALRDSARADVAQIQRAAQRAAAITSQLLAFSRKQILRPQLMDLNDVVHGFVPVLMQTLSSKIELKLELSDAPAMVLADRGQLEQVLLNLVRNARDATADDGSVTIKVGEVWVDAETFRPHQVDVAPGPYHTIAVSDTGPGISPEVLSHIFEPFFTTKHSGGGSGLGLSTAYGIVKQSDGYLWADSELGKGATFRVYLPKATGSPRLNTPPDRPSIQHFTGTVLIAEDESGVRSMMSRVLSEAGFKVVEATDGHEALNVLRSSVDAPCAIVTDVVMPGMGGAELARRIAQEFPRLPVLFVSGFSDDEAVRRGLLDPGQPFLEKPFSSEDLVLRLQALLEEHLPSLPPHSSLNS
jgi:two-component system, cell cycle sensor histidine kinase and response regulator CckA